MNSKAIWNMTKVSFLEIQCKSAKENWRFVYYLNNFVELYFNILYFFNEKISLYSYCIVSYCIVYELFYL